MAGGLLQVSKQFSYVLFESVPCNIVMWDASGLSIRTRAYLATLVTLSTLSALSPARNRPQTLAPDLNCPYLEIQGVCRRNSPVSELETWHDFRPGQADCSMRAERFEAGLHRASPIMVWFLLQAADWEILSAGIFTYYNR